MGKIRKEQLIGSINSIEIKYGRTVLDNESDSVGVNITGFDSSKDSVMVFINSVYLQKDEDYTISGSTITKVSGTWEAGSIFDFTAFCTS